MADEVELSAPPTAADRGRRWAPTLLRHGGQGLLTLLLASTITFALVPLSPGSPAVSLLQSELNRTPTPAEIAAKEHQLGLDRPLVVQYVDWLAGVVRGDLGRSWRTGQDVWSLVGPRFGPTLLLGITSLAIGLVASAVLALLAARYRNGWIDHSIRLSTLVLAGIPAFVLGLLVLQYVVVGWGVSQVVTDGTWRTVLLPAAVAGLAGVSGRPLRAMLLEEMGSGYAGAMAARGAGRTRVLLHHALPNAMVPFLGMLGLSIGALIGGDVIIESVFSWPGLGSLAVAAVDQRDVPVIQAFVLLGTAAFVIASLGADLAAALLDPRLRVTPGEAGG